MDRENHSLPDPGSNLPKPQAFNTKAAASYLGISASWLSKARMGITATPGPKFKKVGRLVLYTRASCDEFLNS